MDCVTMRFYAELNDFVPAERRQVPFLHCFKGPASVKDVIESLGIPHPEVDLILIDGESAPFSALLKGGESVSVYPVFRSLEVNVNSLVRPEPLDEYRFVLDSHLGKLVSYLRMLGFDTLYRNPFDDADLASISATQKRILLTADRGLLKRKQVVYGYCVRSKQPVQQLMEVVKRFDLIGRMQPFARCMLCNGLLQSVPKNQVLPFLPNKVADFCDLFAICSQCGHIYWQGTHYDNMKEFISRLTQE